MSDVTDLADEAALDAFLADHDRALVMCYTAGCGLCASMEPVLWNAARETGVAVARLNPRDDPPLVERLDVRSVPTLILYEAGVETRRLADGFAPTAEVVAFAEAPES